MPKVAIQSQSSKVRSQLVANDMAAYSLDLRKRVLRAWDSGLDVYSVAAKYEVSRAWVHRLVQRRRETGSIEARKQTKFRHRVLSPSQEERLAALITARPDATLAELRDAVPTTAAASSRGFRTASRRAAITHSPRRRCPTSSRSRRLPRTAR